MEADLEWVFDSLLFVEDFTALELVCASGGQTRIQTNVLFVVRKAPIRNPKLKLLRHWREPEPKERYMSNLDEENHP